MWLALRLFASGALDGIVKGLSAACKWLFAEWYRIALAAVCFYLFWLLMFIIPGLRADLVETEASLAAEEAAHLGTVNAFLEASAQATRDAEANVRRVRAQQQDISNAVSRSYQADLDALRDRFARHRADSLRAGHAAATDPGHADRADLPGLPAAAGRIDAPAGQAGLPSAGALSLEDALIASEQALQLQALIDWVAAQSAVAFTPAPEPK